ncbi:MAG: response regulator [Planctomycetia bacterium]|nr:response regulator [Planctomycetia bacterium]
MWDQPAACLDSVGADAPQTRAVLIIEDDPSQREVLSLRLASQGFRTFEAATAREGLDLAHQHRPHLVLLDVRLPDIDGFRVCQQLDEDPETSHIPVIILSGMERPDIIRRARRVGCHYFVRKPYDPNALLILVENAMAERSET